MAEDTEKPEIADTAEELGESAPTGAEQANEADETAEDTAASKNRLAGLRRRATPRLSRNGRALVAGALVVAVLAGLTGWLGYRAHQKHEAQAQRDLFVQVARQGAVNLTTINYTQVDADVQRILDLATGAFRDDFEQRSKPFIEVVKAAQSKSEGTVTDAGLESQRGDAAQVLVAVAVKSRTAGGEEAPREWRMRIEVRSVGDDAKVANVVFVP
ncbi:MULTISPECIES: Mce protein [unclassified Mycobacterium]|uniref:Mce protein n=1 Tax=unclassified Mycobacterium TaxID=2642494 RepID=UPI0007FCD0BE|nr:MULTISPECIES: Mce protein [unclassified Mycobacterium]OBH18411.1 Mce protein [Mycobacterium sp. E3247]